MGIGTMRGHGDATRCRSWVVDLLRLKMEKDPSRSSREEGGLAGTMHITSECCGNRGIPATVETSLGGGRGDAAAGWGGASGLGRMRRRARDAMPYLDPVCVGRAIAQPRPHFAARVQARPPLVRISSVASSSSETLSKGWGCERKV